VDIKKILPDFKYYINSLKHCSNKSIVYFDIPQSFKKCVIIFINNKILGIYTEKDIKKKTKKITVKNLFCDDGGDILINGFCVFSAFYNRGNYYLFDCFIFDNIVLSEAYNYDERIDYIEKTRFGLMFFTDTLRNYVGGGCCGTSWETSSRISKRTIESFNSNIKTIIKFKNDNFFVNYKLLKNRLIVKLVEYRGDTFFECLDGKIRRNVKNKIKNSSDLMIKGIIGKFIVCKFDGKIWKAISIATNKTYHEISRVETIEKVIFINKCNLINCPSSYELNLIRSQTKKGTELEVCSNVLIFECSNLVELIMNIRSKVYFVFVVVNKFTKELISKVSNELLKQIKFVGCYKTNLIGDALINSNIERRSIDLMVIGADMLEMIDEKSLFEISSPNISIITM
jgi:hypothetical protein